MSEFFGKVRTGLGTVWRSLPILPLLIVLSAVAAALLADFIVPHGPEELNLEHARQGWVFSEGGSWAFPLGTDSLGRDILSRIIKGAQVSMAVAAGTVLLAASIGTTLGTVAGYFGGWVDTLIMRLVDGWLAFPAILIALVFAVTVGPSVTVVVSVLALILWARYARLIRGEVLSLKERDFVALARGSGRIPPADNGFTPAAKRAQQRDRPLHPAGRLGHHGRSHLEFSGCGCSSTDANVGWHGRRGA